jgi:hypothetical protein
VFQKDFGIREHAGAVIAEAVKDNDGISVAVARAKIPSTQGRMVTRQNTYF